MTTKHQAKIRKADILCIRRLIFTDLPVDECASPFESCLENVTRLFPGFPFLLVKFGRLE
jgi:hypothetical protein